jgi:hypothetical protein
MLTTSRHHLLPITSNIITHHLHVVRIILEGVRSCRVEVIIQATEVHRDILATIDLQEAIEALRPTSEA